MRSLIIVLSLGLAGGHATAKPHPAKPESAPAVKSLLECRTKSPDAARLACYDAAAVTLDTAVSKNEVVVVDRVQVREAKRSLFGFTLPDLGLFRGVDEKAAEERQILATVASAHAGGDGNWTVTLDTGATWMQTDGQIVARAPRVGDPVTIVRAALGSYFLRIGKQPGVRARRVS